jgi:hypothetical protein
MASKVIGLSARSPVEAKSALIVISSRSPSVSSPKDLHPSGQGRDGVAWHRDFVHVPAIAPQANGLTARKAGATAAPQVIDGWSAGD